MPPDDISAGARTVAHMSLFFEELKAGALELAEQIPAQDRGYFRPEEEDHSRALLVSYWQARNALFELIASFRREHQEDDPQHPAAFLVAFSAAVLLVDAARFLRENFHAHPVVREKLNEPAPDFGIPAGTYDTVQHSLISARHVWHLYYAISYFDEHQAELSRLAAGSELAPAYATIERLRDRLDVSALQFAQARVRLRGGQARRLAMGAVGRALYGLQKLVSSMMADVFVRPGHRPQLPASVVDPLTQLLAPGDVLVVRKEYALTNYFLPGYWPHAALFLGNADQLQQLGIADHENVRPRWQKLVAADSDSPWRVLEAMKDGVRIRPLASPFGADSVVVLRPRLSTDEIAAALSKGLAHEGKPYDFNFDFPRSDRLVCTEVVYRAYEGVGPIRLGLTRRAGRLTLSGGDLIAEGHRRVQFEPVALFAPAFSEEVLSGAAAAEILETAQQCEANASDSADGPPSPPAIE